MQENNYLSYLKKIKMHEDTRWFVKTNPQGEIREVKQVYDPEDYVKGSRARKLLTQDELINVLSESIKR
tara:strand:- start:12843 stop:13049 length:207 start_codon:yes stop_codon:yes gene_type:complete